MVCTNDVEQQELAITLQGNADKMPVHFNIQFNYTIRQQKHSSDCNVDRVGREHETTAIRDTKLKS